MRYLGIPLVEKLMGGESVCSLPFSMSTTTTSTQNRVRFTQGDSSTLILPEGITPQSAIPAHDRLNRHKLKMTPPLTS